MEKEIVIRNPENKRIQQMVKVDISEEIESECKRCFNEVLFKQSQQISQLFELIDQKHTYGIISEIATAILGIDEFNSLNNDNKKRYQSQYHRNMDRVFYCLINLSTQLTFSLSMLDDNILDQTFIKTTIQTILFLNENYINKFQNNIMPSQKEVLNGLINKLVGEYNKRINKAIFLCEQNDSWWSRAIIFSNSTLNGCSYFEAFANVLVNSQNKTQFKQRLIENKLNITIKEQSFNKNESLISKA